MPTLDIRTPNPRPALTIKEWEANAPLGDVEIKSVAVLKAACEQRPVCNRPPSESVHHRSIPQ